MATKTAFHPYGIVLSSPSGDVVITAGENMTILPQGNIFTISAQIPASTATIGTIGGSIALNQVAVGSGTNTIAGSSNLTFDGTTFKVNTGAIITGQYSNLAGTAYINPDGSAVFGNGSGTGLVVANTGAVTINAALKLSGTSVTAIAINDNIIFGDVSNSDLIAKDTVEDILGLYITSYLPTRRYDYFNDFINPVSATSQGGDSLLALAISGGTIAAQPTDAANRVGIVRSSTGATTTGRAGASSQVGAIRFGGGTWITEQYINIATLSNSTDRFQALFGFQDVVSAANQVDGAYFLYDEGGISTGSAASANWQLVTTSNSVRTFSTTSAAVAAATWVKLTVQVNAAGTLVTFLINGVSVGTIATNIPTGAGRETGFGWLLIKSAGTTARTLDTDYLFVQSNFTSNR